MKRLETVCKDLSIGPEGESNEAVRRLADEKIEMLDRCTNESLNDVILAAYTRAMVACQAHGLQTALRCATALDKPGVARLLRQCLREAYGVEKHLGLLQEDFMEAAASVPVKHSY